MVDCSNCEKFSSCAQPSSPWDQTVCITPHLFNLTPCKNGVSISLADAYQGPKLNTVSKAWQAEWSGTIVISLSAGDAPVDATQHPVGFLCCSSLLSIYIELIIHQGHQVPLQRAAPQQDRLLFSWIIFSLVQDHMYLSDFLLAHSVSLSRSSYRVALPSEVSTFPLSFPPPANCARVHLIIS